MSRYLARRLLLLVPTLVGVSILVFVLVPCCPNVSAAIIVLATTQFGTAILAESTLSFLGYGVPPPFPTWGSMLSGTGARACSNERGCRSGLDWPLAWWSSASTGWAMRCGTSSTRAFAAAADSHRRECRWT